MSLEKEGGEKRFMFLEQLGIGYGKVSSEYIPAQRIEIVIHICSQCS